MALENIVNPAYEILTKVMGIDKRDAKILMNDERFDFDLLLEQLRLNYDLNGILNSNNVNERHVKYSPWDFEKTGELKENISKEEAKILSNITNRMIYNFINTHGEEINRKSIFSNKVLKYTGLALSGVGSFAVWLGGIFAGGTALSALSNNVFAQQFSPSLDGNGKYTIYVNDNNYNPIDSALVTFGDSTKYTNEDGIVFFFNPTIVGVQDDNIEKPHEFNVSNFYPNPVKSDKIKFNVNANNDDLSIKLYNILGQEIASFNENVSSNSSISINGLSDLPNGVYIANIRNGKQSKAIKFVNLNNGNNPHLSVNVLPSYFPATPESPNESYIELHVMKNGFLDYEANIDTSQHNINVILDKAFNEFSGAVLDNVKYAFNDKDTLDAKVVVYYNGVSEEQTGRTFSFQIQSNVNYLDSVKVVGVNEDTSFVLTEIDFPVDGDLRNLEFLVTTYDGLIYGHNVPDSIAVNVEQYEKMTLQGIFGSSDYDGLRGPYLKNVNNPIYENPDPTTDHGYEYVIPLTQMSDIDPTSLPWTEEQQQQVKQIIETDIQEKYNEDKRIRVRILTANDTLPVFTTPEGYIRPYPGVFIVSRGTGGFSYAFSAFDYNQDGWTDGAYIKLGGDFYTNKQGRRQELHSIHVTMPLEPNYIPGDVNYRSVFLQSGQSAEDFTQSVDNKMINGLVMNMSDELMTFYTENGIDKIRVNYLPKKPQRELLGQ